MRDICETLGFNRSSFYYHRQEDPSEVVLRSEIEKLAGRYPRYGYRRITQLLLRQGYTVGTRRVARLIKESHLLVCVKRACRTTQSLQRIGPWSNCLEILEVSRPDQVWVGDITYVRLKRRFVYVSLLMHVFIRMIGGRQVSQHLNQPLTLKPLQQALRRRGSDIHYSDQGVQYLSSAYVTKLEEHGVEISVTQQGRPWENETMPKDSSARSRRKKLTSMTIKTSPRLDNASGSLSYHQKRPHSALGYLTPMEFQQQTFCAV